MAKLKLKRLTGTAQFKGTLNYDLLRLDHQGQLNKINDVVVETATAVQGLTMVLREAKEKLAAGQKTLVVVVPNKKTKNVPLQRNLKRHVARVEEQIDTRAYVQALVFAVTIVEDYLASNLIRLVRSYPPKLLVSTKGKQLRDEESYPVDMRDVVAAASIDELLCVKATQRVREAMFSAPSQYLKYFQTITGVELTDRIWWEFIEVKATRDLYVHGDGTINEIYLGKVGKKARGQAGAIASVNVQYFESAISSLKGLMAEVYIGLRAKYCDSEPLHRLFEAARQPRTD